jgi:hypothetical protein
MRVAGFESRVAGVGDDVEIGFGHRLCAMTRGLHRTHHVVAALHDDRGEVADAIDVLQQLILYSYDETAVLAKQREQAILREALARDLAGMVVRRLAAL